MRGQHLARDVDLVQDPHQVVVQVLVEGELSLVDDRGIPAQQPVHDIAQRRNHPSQVKEATLGVQDLAQHAAIGLRSHAAHDLVLQSVDPVADAVEERKVPVGDRVQDGVQQVASRRSHRGNLLAPALLHLCQRGRRLPVDADDVVLAGDEMNLAQSKVAALAFMLDHFVSDQHVLLRVRVELRTLVPLLNVLARQLVQADLLGEQRQVSAVWLL